MTEMLELIKCEHIQRHISPCCHHQEVMENDRSIVFCKLHIRFNARRTQLIRRKEPLNSVLPNLEMCPDNGIGTKSPVSVDLSRARFPESRRLSDWICALK